MKKLFCLIVLMTVLTGCGAEETFETITDTWEIPAVALEREISVSLPGETSEAIPCNNGLLYLCDEYEISVETMASGDLLRTVQEVSGHDVKDMTVMATESDGVKRYDFVWTAAGENGERLGRCAVLDDGNYHYVLSVLRDAEPVSSAQIIWNDVFQSFSLA